MKGKERDKGSEDFLWEGVLRAQQHGLQNGIKPGTVVAHPSDPVAYILECVDIDQATVSLPADVAKGQPAVRRTFPLREIFDVNLALGFAIEQERNFFVKQFGERFNARDN